MKTGGVSGKIFIHILINIQSTIHLKLIISTQI